MRQDAGQVCIEALVDGQQAFGFDGFDEAVEEVGVEVTGLVVHARHDCVCSARAKSVSREGGGLGGGAGGSSGEGEKKRKRTGRMHDTADDEAADGAAHQM